MLKKSSINAKLEVEESPLTLALSFSAVVYVLRTGIQWKALPKKVFGSQVQFIDILEHGNKLAFS